MHTKFTTIPTDTGTLVAQILTPSENDTQKKKPALLVIHGWQSAMNRYPSRVEQVVEMGYVAVLFDLRGHGETGGDLTKLSIKDHLDDCLAAYDFMTDLAQVDSKNISVFGSSYGGYLAALLSTRRSVNSLVLNVPADYPDDIFDTPDRQRSEQTTEYRKVTHQADEGQALTAISEFAGNLLLIEAEFDEQVNPQVMKNYRHAAREGYDYALIKGADHSMKNPGTNEARIQVLTNWFRKLDY